MKKTNILYIHTHDSGRYLQPYGYPIDTPNIMQLAVQGTLFRHCYCAGPTCSPSRAGLLTGMSPHSCGMLGLAHRGWQLNDYSRHLVQYLNRNNYDTALCGVQHEAPNAEMIGYGTIITDRNSVIVKSADFEKRDVKNAQDAASYLIRRAEEQAAKPFFLSFGMLSTHRDFPAAGPDIKSDYVMPPSHLYDCRQNREDMSAYIRSAQIADRCTGIVLSALRESGMEQETIIIFTTDHGIAFPKMKCNLYDTGIGVSLIIKYPGNQTKSQALDALVSNIDIFPTLCELVDLDKPNWLQGVSLLGVLEGKTQKVRDEIFSEVTYHAAYEPMRCIRSERYKLIRFYDYHNRIVPANIDDSPSKSFLLDSGLLHECRPREMLFDLYLDPVERINLIDDPRYGEIYRDLSLRLGKWMKDTDDPLLTSGYRVVKPEKATVNTLDSMSPRAQEYE